jgi:hypothetical protein
MKKITALIMMAIMITIGGVYAAWIYATGTTATFEEKGVGITLIGAQANNEMTVGTFSMSEAVNVDIDDDESDATLHKAVLRVGGGMTITFTANDLAGDANVKNYGIKMSLTLKITEKTYKDKVIFKAAKAVYYSPVISGTETTKAADESKNEIGTYTKTGDGVFTWTLTESEILSMLVFNEGEDLILDSIAAHNAFADALAGGTAINFVIEHIRQS